MPRFQYALKNIPPISDTVLATTYLQLLKGIQSLQAFLFTHSNSKIYFSGGNWWQEVTVYKDVLPYN